MISVSVNANGDRAARRACGKDWWSICLYCQEGHTISKNKITTKIISAMPKTRF